MRGPAIKTLMANPFVVVVFDNEDNVIDWEVCAKRGEIHLVIPRFKHIYPGKKIRVYKFLLHAEIDGTD